MDKKNLSPRMQIPFHKSDVGSAEINALTAVLRSGWISSGSKVLVFEEALKKQIGCRELIALSSCWAGLFSVLKLFGIGPGDEVITTALTFAATANVIEQVGATTVLADISDAMLLSAESVEGLLTKKTKAIIGVDYAGFPADYHALKKIATKHKKKFSSSNPFHQALGRILVLADSAHSFGSFPIRKFPIRKNSSAQKPLSRLSALSLHADIGVYSFHAVKNITTAEGGAIAIFNKRLRPKAALAQLRCFILHGISRDAYSREKDQKSNLRASKYPRHWEYDITAAGYKFNMTDMQAALGLVQLQRLPRLEKKRQAIEACYAKILSKSKLFRMAGNHLAKNMQSWHIARHLFVVELRLGRAKERDLVLQRLYAHGIAANLHYRPLYTLKYYKEKYNFTATQITKRFPKTEEKASRILSLPFHSKLTKLELSYITSIFQRVEDEILKEIQTKH